MKIILKLFLEHILTVKYFRLLTCFFQPYPCIDVYATEAVLAEVCVKHLISLNTLARLSYIVNRFF